MSTPKFCLDTPMARAMTSLFVRLEEQLQLRQVVRAYLAGGMAVHLYTGYRQTGDIDVEFSARIVIPGNLVAQVQIGNQWELLHFDTAFNPMFGLMHENYQEDAIKVPLDLKFLHLFVLSPIDLAVSKLARFADNDQEDILTLVRLGLTSIAGIEQRAHEALSGYVGNPTPLLGNIRDLIAAERRR